MTTFNPSDRTCFPANAAPGVTEEVCICQVCHTQWASRGQADREGCSFCGAPADAVTVVSEAPDYSGRVLR